MNQTVTRQSPVYRTVAGVMVMTFDNGNTVSFCAVGGKMLVSVNRGQSFTVGADAFADVLGVASNGVAQ